MNRTWLAIAVLIIAGLAPAQAQTWPSRPVRFVNPFPAGGTSDLLGRLVAERVSQSLGQQVLVENRTGNGGLIGGEFVARAAPDGYTIAQVSMGMMSVNPTLLASMPFDPDRDLRPVVNLAGVHNILVTEPKLPVGTVAELIAYAKQNPGKLSYASAGNGSSLHLAGALFTALTGTEMLHVPYRGTVPTLMDMTNSRVSLMFGSMPEILSHVQAGSIKAIAFATSPGSPLLPHLPTVADSGVPGFRINNWFGVAAPAGTPTEIVERLNREFNAALQAPDLSKRLTEMGFQVLGGTPEEFAATIRADRETWAGVIRSQNIRPD